MPADLSLGAREFPKSEGSSEQLAIHDKSGVLRYLVVKLHRGEVCLVRLPVYAGRSGTLRLFINALDQRSADASSTRGLAGEQILQIAGQLNGRGAPVKQIVHQPDQNSVAI